MKVSLAILCALVAACHRDAHKEVPAPEDEKWMAPPVFEQGEAKIVEAKRQLIASPISAGGRIVFDDLRVSHVLSPVSGRVTRVIAELGQHVEKGSPLVAIASPDVGGAIADEVKARADLTAAQREFDRQQKIFAASAGSRRDVEAAEDDYRKAKVEEERARQRLRFLRTGTTDAVTQQYTLTSPIAGRVITRNVNPGLEVQGQFSGGTPSGELFAVGDTDDVWLLADVADTDFPEVRLGAAVTVRVLAYPGRVFSGRVDWISPTLDPVLRTGRVRCVLSNVEGLLKPEMFGSVLIDRPPLFVVGMPREAVETINDHDFVYVQAGTRPDGKLIFKRRLVKTPRYAAWRERRARVPSEVFLPAEPREPEIIAVWGGLSDGERVLLQAQQPHSHQGEEVFLTESQFASGKVSIVSAEEGAVTDGVTIGGRLAFDDLRVTHVFPPVGGRITEVQAGPGQHVLRGAPLAVILSPDLASAFSDELKGRADLTAAEHELRRQREMNVLKASSDRDLQVAEDNYRRSAAEYERAAGKTRLLRAGARDAVTQEFVLRSPIDGDVIARNANPGLQIQGQYSAGSNVQEMFTIGSIDDLWLVGDVYESDLPYVERGALVELRVAAYPERIFGGRVDWISDVVDPVLRTVKIRCVLDNHDHLLRAETYGVVTIGTPLRRAVTVPREAVLRLGDETDVFVEARRPPDGRVGFQRRAVLVDEQVPGDMVPILSGLQPGERVVSRGSIFLVGN